MASLFPRMARDIDGGRWLESFLVSAVVSILGIRFYLEATGYPQIGGHGLHIAHMLWGGLFMVVAIVVLLAFVGKRIQQFGAVVGGIGFGMFIDELGKFITSDNNYFYEPTFALIYVIFIVPLILCVLLICALIPDVVHGPLFNLLFHNAP